MFLFYLYAALNIFRFDDLKNRKNVLRKISIRLVQKLNPENGICLSPLYDKAFDKGLITISPDDYTVRISSALREYEKKEYFNKHFGSINGQRITMPIEHKPNRDYLAYHRDNIFLGK